jgi:hypothetical protein
VNKNSFQTQLSKPIRKVFVKRVNCLQLVYRFTCFQKWILRNLLQRLLSAASIFAYSEKRQKQSQRPQCIPFSVNGFRLRLRADVEFVLKIQQS